MSFDRLGRFAVRRRWWIVAAWAVLLLAALPFAPQAPGALSAGGFILDDLESARAKQVLQEELGRGAVGVRPRLHLGHADGRDAGSGWPRSTRRPQGVATAPHVTRILSHALSPAPGQRRRPHRLRHRVPRPAAGRLARCHPARRGRPARGPRPARPDRRRPGVLRRRPGGHRERPPAQRADLAAPGGPGAPARLRQPGRRRRAARGGRRVGAGRAGRHLRRRVRDPDEHLRAQPGHAAGPRPGRGLLAADDEPLPRGAGAPRGTGPRGGGRPRDRRDRRSGRVLLRPHRAARPPGPRPVRVHDPALGGHRRGDRGRARRWPRPSRSCRRSSRSSAPGSTGSASARSRWSPAPTAPWARLARRVMRHPVAVLVPTLSFLLLLGRPVPQRPVQRPGRHDPPRVGAVPRGVRRPGPGVRRGRVRAARHRRPHDRRRHDPGERGRAVRLLAPPRRRPADQPRGELRGPRRAPHARAVPAPVRLARRARRTGSSPRPSGRRRRATSPPSPSRRPSGPTTRRPAPSCASCATPRARSPRPPASRSSWAAAPPTWTTWCRGCGPTSRAPRRSSSSPRSSSCSSCCGPSSCRSRRW